MSRKASKTLLWDNNNNFYKLLNVSSRATTDEIKTAYRKLALTLHPDRHDGDQKKINAFREVSEAYTILIDQERRRQYDMAHGYRNHHQHQQHHHRVRKTPHNYRKVYAPHAPPDGKWHDAQKHYDMHYGDGMFQEAIQGAYERAKQAGELEYHSPLGKGFTFEKNVDTTVGGVNNGGGAAASGIAKNAYYYSRNPYSKAEQGPPSQQYQYEEGYVSMEAKTLLKRKAAVVNKLHERRMERHQKKDLQRQQEQYRTAVNVPGSKVYPPFHQQPWTSSATNAKEEEGCVIM